MLGITNRGPAKPLFVKLQSLLHQETACKRRVSRFFASSSCGRQIFADDTSAQVQGAIHQHLDLDSMLRLQLLHHQEL